MSDIRTFRKGETVILHDGTKQRNSIELAEVGKDCQYIDDEVLLITFGAFNAAVPKSSVHKMPVTLKHKLKEQANG